MYEFRRAAGIRGAKPLSGDGATTVIDHDVARSRLPTLTALRFFAAALVVLVHLGVIWPIPALARGQLGVSFFYLLSGFILTWAPSMTDTPRRFYRRRFARIAPLHVVTWLIAVAVVEPFFGSPSPLLGNALSLVLLQSWLPIERIAFSANTPSWSLSVEVLFYALFPLLIPLLRRRSPRVLWCIGGVMGLLVLVVPFIVPTVSAAYIFPPARLPEFVIGIVLSLAFQHGWVPPLRLLPASGLALLATLVAMSPATPYRLSFSAVTLVPFALLIAAAAKADLAGTSRLAGPGWVRLGEWSFALFMTHQLVIRVFHAMVPSRAVGELLTLPLVGLCVVVAALAFRFVERPLERWLRGAQGPAVTVTTASRREGAVRPKG